MRFAISEALASLGATALLPILIVNFVGAFVLGWFAERARHAAPWTTPVVAFVGVGVLGSFTTFAAFSVETIELLRSGAWVAGGTYVTLSLAGGYVAAMQGKRMAPPS